MSRRDAAELPLSLQLSRLIVSLWIPQAIHAAAALGVADALARGPSRSEVLAATLTVSPDALHRLLRALSVLGLCREDEDGTFTLTPLGDCLRAESPESVRNWALVMGGAMVWRGWGRLAECVRTGRSAPSLDGKGTFESMAEHPEDAAVFDRAMAELTRRVSHALLSAYDFSAVHRIVDVGGGRGELLATILTAQPQLTGVVFDLPHCQDGACQLIAASGLSNRCEFVSGDFFETVPAGADLYVLKSVVHDWDDARSHKILQVCHAAMPADARLLVVEVLMPERLGAGALDAMITFSDLNMLAMTGGRERTAAQYERLIEHAGFRVSRIVATRSAYSVIEATRSEN